MDGIRLHKMPQSHHNGHMKKYSLFLLLALLVPLSAAAENVFYLYTNSPDLPWTRSLSQGVTDTLSRRSGWSLYHENLDLPRLSPDFDEAKWLEYLAWKYKSVKFDMAFAESAEASALLNEHGRELFGDIPIVLYSSTTIPSSKSVFALLSQSEKATAQTYQMARAQNPEANKLFIVNNTTIYDNLESELRSLALAEGLEVSTLSGFTLDSLYSAAGTLPSKSFIIYFPVYHDVADAQLIPYEVLKTLCARTSIPVYTLWTSLLGTGVVGGSMIDAKKTAAAMFLLADTYRDTGSYEVDYSTVQPYLDWNAVVRFQLRVRSLPDDVVFVNKPISPFTAYRTEILVSALAVLTLFSLLLLFSYRLLTRANRSLLTANRELEAARAMAEDLSRHDSLTGLLNRRALMGLVNDEMARTLRTGMPLSALLLDVDHFKHVNDRYGHETGDRALKQIADTVKTAIRKTDRLARWGGEEFLIISPDTDSAQVAVMAEKVRIAVERCDFHEGPPIRISGGCSQFNGAEDFQTWLSRVDSALYRAKNEGRNRICPA